MADTDGSPRWARALITCGVEGCREIILSRCRKKCRVVRIVGYTIDECYRVDWLRNKVGLASSISEGHD